MFVSCDYALGISFPNGGCAVECMECFPWECHVRCRTWRHALLFFAAVPLLIFHQGSNYLSKDNILCCNQLAYHVFRTVQRDKVLEDVLRKILDNHNEGQTLKDEALTKELSSLRVDIQRDVSFQLESNVRKMVVSVEQLVREYLSGTNAGHGGLGDTNRIILTSVARDLAFLRYAFSTLTRIFHDEYFSHETESFPPRVTDARTYATCPYRRYGRCARDLVGGIRASKTERSQNIKFGKKLRVTAAQILSGGKLVP